MIDSRKVQEAIRDELAQKIGRLDRPTEHQLNELVSFFLRAFEVAFKDFTMMSSQAQRQMLAAGIARMLIQLGVDTSLARHTAENSLPHYTPPASEE